jgi:hypothetical protein
MSVKENTLYIAVIQVTYTYLGPAAERFVSRQVQNHLDKKPETMTKRDLVKLIDWMRVAMSLLTDDTAMVEEYTAQLHRLTAKHARKGKPHSAK